MKLLTLGLLSILGILHRFLDGFLYGGLKDLVVDCSLAGMSHNLFDGLFNRTGKRTQLVNENCDGLFRLLLLIRRWLLFGSCRLPTCTVVRSPIGLECSEQFFNSLRFANDQS